MRFSLFGAIASRDQLAIGRWLDEEPGLATHPIRVGASRQDPDTYFLHSIHHYVYAGDTALHIAAAAYQRELAESLIAQGADIRAETEGAQSRSTTRQMGVLVQPIRIEMGSVK